MESSLDLVSSVHVKTSYNISDDQADEEQTELLSGASESDERGEPGGRWAWSRKHFFGTFLGLIVLSISGTFTRSLLFLGPLTTTYPNEHFFGAELRSNGTHDFKRTVLIVSIDGLRADYLDRGLTPHLLDIGRQGLRAKYMKPIFPTLTFPNHWTIMTGLYAESHGIVANNFWDPETKSEFHYTRKSCWNASWWLGEPMWETAGRAGLTTANLMWLGPPTTTSGASSTYSVLWKDNVPLREKHDQIMQWIDLPLEERPQLIMAYEPSVDQAGHEAGPMSALVNETLSQVDVFAKDLHTSLQARNLTDIVDIIFVSDHGMADTGHPELVYIDDIIGEEGLKQIEHEDGWPSMGLHFSPHANATYYLEALSTASDANPGKFNVYTPQTMPESYHFAHNERIAPIYLVPKIGYYLTTRKQGEAGVIAGNHGFDNEEPLMHAIFVAHGPFSAVTRALHRSRSSLFTRFLSRPSKGWHSTSDDTYIMEGFQNVEIYNLVMKLLGIEEGAASTNGTAGFWDQYF